MNTKAYKFPVADPRVRRKMKRAQRKLIKQIIKPKGQAISAVHMLKHFRTATRAIERTLPQTIPQRATDQFLALIAAEPGTDWPHVKDWVGRLLRDVMDSSKDELP